MQNPPPGISDRLNLVRSRIADAEQRWRRESGSVRLLAVSKTRSATEIRQAAAAGQVAFGESYLQEALTKIEALSGVGLEWHFIGPIQTNKTRGIAEHFDWVHSVDRLRIAQRLNEQRPPHLPPLQVCLQINISGEASKSGVEPAQLPALAQAVAGLDRLRLRGLMAVPAPADDFDAQRAPFAAVRGLFEDLRGAGLDLDTLSMGMSDDMEAAIAEGANLVRIGTAIFGPRAARN